jgi:hypothetical protein
MNTTKSQILIVFILIAIQRGYTQGFVNLNFESANVSGYSPGLVPTSAALPGWTAYYGYGPSTNPTQEIASTISYDDLSLGNAAVVLVDTNMGSPYTALQGQYSVLLEGSIPAAASVASFGQTGTIPLTAQSLTLIGIIGPLQISFNGQPLTYQLTGSYTNQSIYGADIPVMRDKQANYFSRPRSIETLYSTPSICPTRPFPNQASLL